MRDYMSLQVGLRSFLLHQTLGDLERRLDPASFIRVHRSTIVRRDFIAKLRHDGLLKRPDCDAQRILLDELAARLDHVAHQLGEDRVGDIGLVDLHHQHRAVLRIERGFPELLGVHLAETLVALDRPGPCGPRRGSRRATGSGATPAPRPWRPSPAPRPLRLRARQRPRLSAWRGSPWTRPASTAADSSAPVRSRAHGACAPRPRRGTPPRRCGDRSRRASALEMIAAILGDARRPARLGVGRVEPGDDRGQARGTLLADRGDRARRPAPAPR
jgi:hypothetical protein